MFDDYSATLPLIIVVVFETFSVAWLYGADRRGLFRSSGRVQLFFLCDLEFQCDRRSLATCLFRFLDDIEAMLGWRPSVIYKYLWKYICLLGMLGLLGATTIRMFIHYPTYNAWNQEKVQKIWHCKLNWCYFGCSCRVSKHSLTRQTAAQNMLFYFLDSQTFL